MPKTNRRILIVSATPPPYSGPEVMTAQLLESNLRDRFTLLHYNISKGRDASTKARFDLVNIIYGIVQPLKLFFLILYHHPDLIYTNLAQNMGGFLRYTTFILVAAVCHVPVVVRVMGDGFDHFYARSSPGIKSLIRFTLSKIDGFIVRANSLKKQFSELVPAEKLNVVYSGINVDEFDQPGLRIDDGRSQILFVGYLTQAKGALDLLQAVPEVVATHQDAYFGLMGPKIDIERNVLYIENPTSNQLTLNQLLKHPDIAQHVTLLGVKSGMEKIRYFCSADLFVLPSYSEAFPTVVLEAMAAGLPVIATPVGALPEVFDERSIIFVQPGDVPGLVRAITTLLDDPGLMKRMGDYNKMIVRSKFSNEAYADATGNIFKSVIGW